MNKTEDIIKTCAKLMLISEMKEKNVNEMNSKAVENYIELYNNLSSF